MKLLPTTVVELLRRKDPSPRNLRLLFRFFGILLVLVLFFTVGFHFLMVYEGKSYSWVSGLYWTMVMMTTLGLGDITFESDLGRFFSIIVLLSGLVFLLVLLPFTFIEFFYAPWMARQTAARAPRRLSESVSGHVILSHYDAISLALIRKLEQYNHPYVILCQELDDALRLHDEGLNVLVGAPNDPATYRAAGAERAALIASTAPDIPNANIVFTARQVAPRVPIAATAKEQATFEILQMAGADLVLRMDEMLGRFLGRCTDGAPQRAHVVGDFGPLLIAEATAGRTSLVGKSLRQCQLREQTGVLVVGRWERGEFHPAHPDTVISPNTVLLLAGSQEQIESFNRQYRPEESQACPVIIIGGGRVGRATATALNLLGVDFRIIERSDSLPVPAEKRILGDAADTKTLRSAGFLRAKTVLITSHDDDTNIYLTILCRRLRPDIQIIARATLERNVGTLHRAGADFVMSYASLGANAIFNFLTRGKMLMIAEGLNVFQVPTPPKLVGKTLGESRIREQTGCSLAAVKAGHSTRINPPPDYTFEPTNELILVGSADGETAFLAAFKDA